MDTRLLQHARAYCPGTRGSCNTRELFVREHKAPATRESYLSGNTMLLQHARAYCPGTQGSPDSGSYLAEDPGLPDFTFVIPELLERSGSNIRFPSVS